jgi:hypothetical protein
MLEQADLLNRVERAVAGYVALALQKDEYGLWCIVYVYVDLDVADVS